MTPLRVLLVEDSPNDAKLVLRALRAEGRSLEVERVEDAEAMRRALETGGWDVVLSDWSLPNFSALAALQVLKESGLDLPFIIVSGTVGEEAAVDAMRAGARDYVLKDKLGRLMPAVERELRDQAERTKGEVALRRARARITRLLESGLVGIVVAKIDGAILEANGAFLEMVGYSPQDLASGSMRWTGMTPPEWHPVNETLAEQLSERGVAGPFEKEYFRKDGSRVPALVGVASLEGEETIALAIDLSERKRAEAGRARAEEALRRSADQLRQAQKMEAVGRLAGGVAHDFNNVLSVILSYVELILGDLRPGDPLRADVEEMRKAAERAAALTHHLLLFSRQDVVQPRVLELHEAIAGMDKMLRRVVGEDVDLAFVAPNVSGRVHVDPGQIEQVILNLVLNARDAMPTGGKLTIETSNVELDEAYASIHVPARPGRYVMMAVSDSGTGMDRETQARIFEPFFTTKPIGQGTGLGLSTVFGIVQQSGGHVWVYSEPGQGSTFKIYLPRVDAEVDLQTTSLAPKTLRGSEVILLVEDEEQVRAVVAGALRRSGYEVLVANGAREAMRFSDERSGKIDLLLTDVVMPQMGGPELARRLAATRPEMRVLCMSGYTDDAVVRHGVLESGVAFIQKPITPAVLAKKVREVLD